MRCVRFKHLNLFAVSPLDCGDSLLVINKTHPKKSDGDHIALSRAACHQPHECSIVRVVNLRTAVEISCLPARDAKRALAT